MKLEAIQSAIEDYRKYILSKYSFRFDYLYEVTDHLHHNFTTKDNYSEVVEQGLKSTITQRLWHRERYEPKEGILILAKHSPDFFQNAMRDLLNEEKALENRIDRFKFYCDEMLSMYKSDHKHSTFNNHHVDESFISLLLMGKYPSAYAYYHHELFVAITEKTGAKPIPTVNDYPRYTKIMKIILNFIEKDESLMEAIKARNPAQSKMANLAIECMAISCDIDLTA